MNFRQVCTASASILIVCGLAAPASAQLCAGSVAITSSRPFQAGVGVSFTESSTGITGSFAGGNDVAFGRVSVGRLSNDDLDIGSTAFGVTVGGQVATDAARRGSVCPFFSLAREFANDIEDSGLDVSANTLLGGVSFGYTLAESGTIRLVPTVGVGIGRVKVRAEFEGISESDSETIGVFEAGLGIVMNTRFSITPRVSVPFLIEDGDVAFSIIATVGFGQR